MVCITVRLTTAAAAGNPPGAPDDHFMCYQVRNTAGAICRQSAPNEGAICTTDADCGGGASACLANRLIPFNAALQDQFDNSGPVDFSVMRTSALCLPADVNSAGTIDPVTHLQSYEIRRATGGPAQTMPRSIALLNQLGSTVVDAIRPNQALVPAAENATAAVPAPNNAQHNVDHFECYKVKLSKGVAPLPKGIQVHVQESLQDVVYDVKNARQLCSPVDVNGTGVKNPAGDLLCYRVKLAKKVNGAPVNQGAFMRRSGLYVNSQFGPARLDAVAPAELCVPSVQVPTLKFTDPPNGDLVLAGNVHVALDVAGGTQLAVTLDGTDITAALAASPGLRDGTVAGVAEGSHVLQAAISVNGASYTAQVAFDAVALNSPDDCEVLNNAECLLPYPSSRFLVPAATATGYRLNLPAIGMPTLHGPALDPAPLNELDGFSPTVQILMHFPQGVDPVLSDASRLLPAGCCGQPVGPPWIDTRTYTGRSLDPDSPTILLDADTGERILHFIEPDGHAQGNLPRQTLFMRPGKSLAPGHRYVVAMRNLKDANGAAVVAEAAFAALRDGRPTLIPAIESRRAAMEQNVFATLAAHGIARQDLVLAFDFVVQSDSQLTRQMLSMRDQAFTYLQQVEANPAAVPFTVDAVTTHDCNAAGQVVWRDVSGTFQSPLFLTSDPNLPGVVQFLNVDANDVPVQNGFTAAAYSISIPCSVLNPSGPVSLPVVLGHGLFGSGSDMTQSVPSGVAAVTDWTYIAGATDWRGLSSADLIWVAFDIIGTSTSQLNNFPALPDRLRQGMLNTLVLARMMKRGLFNRDPAFQLAGGAGVFPGPSEEMYYYGISLGGIMGTWLAALTPDIDRLGVDVPAINFSCLIQRSTQFTAFQQLFQTIGLIDPMQTVLGIGLLHELWVSAEPAGYARHITTDVLPGTLTPKHILMTAGWLDKQVSNQCTEIAARTLELSSLDGSLQHGLQQIPDTVGPLDSAFVMYDTGSFDLFNPAHQPFIPPLSNLIPSPVCDPHVRRPQIPAGILQLVNFLQPGGQVVNFCSGVCDAGSAIEQPPSACDPLQ